MFGFGKKTETQSESLDKNERAAGQLEKQKELGADILDRLKVVVEERSRTEEGGPNLVLGKLENNAGKYSIILSVKDNFGTHFLRGFNVDLRQEAEELSVQTGPYNENEYYGLDQMNEFIQRVEKEVSEAR